MSVNFLCAVLWHMSVVRGYIMLIGKRCNRTLSSLASLTLKVLYSLETLGFQRIFSALPILTVLGFNKTI